MPWLLAAAAERAARKEAAFQEDVANLMELGSQLSKAEAVAMLADHDGDFSAAVDKLTGGDVWEGL